MPRTKQDAQKRKKHRGRVRKEAPLPILNSERNATNSPPCRYFTGYLDGCSVVIQHSGDIDSLYSMGFFGKGNLSRSEPSFEARQQRVIVPMQKKTGGDTAAPDVVQAIVTSRRKYLAHLRYKALSDDEESVYNDIVQQEQLQFSGYSDDDEEEMEDEDEDGLEYGDINALGRYSFKGNKYPKLTPEELYKMPRSLLVALLTQVALMSKEPIATFVRVPCSLTELETKYRMLRLKQVAFLKGFAKDFQNITQQASLPLSNLLSSVNANDGGDSESGGFGKKGIINLEEGDDDAVVVLNSDDDDGDDEKSNDGDEDDSEEDGNKRKKTRNGGGDAMAEVKGWDDSDDEGDADFWGMGKGVEEDGKGSDCMELSGTKDAPEDVGPKIVDDAIGKETDSLVVCTDEKGSTLEKSESLDKDNSSFKDEGGGKDDQVVKEANEGESSTGLNKIEPEIIMSNSDTAVKHDNKEVLDGCQHKGKDIKLSDSKPETASDSHCASSESKTINTATATADPTALVKEAANGDVDDDDDVICVEEESAQPATLHQFLSQASTSNQPGHADVTAKHVTFLSSITEDPQHVSTQVGFKSWKDVLHFNFNGDPNHLPTGMAVHDGDEDGKSDSSSSKADADKLSSDNWVYERVHPPINSLIASRTSKGSVMKQRNDPIPYLDEALYHLQQRFVTQRSPKPVHSSGLSPARAQSKQGHPYVSIASQSNPQKTSLWSHVMSQPAMASTSSQSHHPRLSSSSSQLKAMVTPTQLQLYVKVFQADTGTDADNEKEENEKHDSSNENDDSEMMLMLHTQLRKTGLLKLKEQGSGQEQCSDDSVSQQSALHIFNKMLSNFLTSQQISIEQELMLLRILMYDETSVTANPIPRELVSDLKSQISPGQISCLLERMDYVQICVESRRRDGPASSSCNEVITIDLSDDEEEEEEEDDEEENMEEDDDNDNADADEEGVVTGDDDDDNKSCEDPSGKEVPASDWVSKGGDSSISSVVGKKRQLDDSPTDAALLNESKKLKSNSAREEDVSSVDNPNVMDGGEGRASDGQKKSDGVVSGDGVNVDPSNCDKVQDVDSNGVGSKCGGSEGHEHSDDGKENQSKGGDSRSCNGDRQEVEDKESGDRSKFNGVSTAKSDCLDSVGGEGSNVKNVGLGMSVTDGKKDGVGEEMMGDEKVAESGCVDSDGDPDEIYIGSSDDEETAKVRNVGGGNGIFYPVSKTDLYCGSDEEGGDNFVIANTSDEDVDGGGDDGGAMMAVNGFGGRGDGGWLRKRNQWRPCLKQDPYPMEERLHLMLEEAFFLTFGLGCLRIVDPDLSPMSIGSLWQRFTVIQEKFLPRYVAYHYFRSKGWVPKSGLKFGCDFILYREGPPFFHGSYSVVVVPVKASTLAHMSGEDQELDFSLRWTSWIALSGLNRITEHVAKELMVCYVIFPKGLTEDDSKSPQCLSQFKVKEVVVSRWVSARERENKEQLEEMP